MANRAAQTLQGPIERVPCPWCGKANDFRTVDHLLTDTDGSMGDGDPGAAPTFECDHCTQRIRVVRVVTTRVLLVRQGE